MICVLMLDYLCFRGTLAQSGAGAPGAFEHPFHLPDQHRSQI